MLLREFLTYDYCPEGAGGKVEHQLRRLTHRLDGDWMRCTGEPCAACRCPVEDHVMADIGGQAAFRYCRIYGCACEGHVSREQQAG
jgi:hypothetical protein